MRQDGLLKAFNIWMRDIGVSISADDAGIIYAADVTAHNLRQCVRVKDKIEVEG